ncbi:fungal-specific transcription factor domain-containing protein [Microdochium trichocladiopsis]|uniref:Fungal-specific transcription factor domain-containing protein n=1 Tax=Microdochium trichocladiopsis TaxID=1682393 RepID=A0A9P8XVL4_9PEZI|nr:fungal-specific transcription factor domain-containing protein [Microdochium trichocladiopsis]KAH7020988.1 fungal-specific transcription factor domain-containing protein [Microdochium trichocladiopsis]
MSRGTPSIPRTAPIAIAPKPLEPAMSSQQSSLGNDNGPVSNMNGHDSADSDSSPQPRKRKLGRDPTVEEASWKRGSPRWSEYRRQREIHSSHSNTTASNSLIEEMANFGGPALLKRTLGLQNDRYSQYIGPTTDFEPSLINLSPFNPEDESLLARGMLRKVSEHDTFLMLPDHNTPGYDHCIQDVDEVVHPSFPIIQKSVFLEKYERDYREFAPPILAVVYLLAMNWWEHSEELSQCERPNVTELERVMRSSLADAMWRPKLSTIQAGLLLSQKPEGDQWAPTAQLVAIAQELGLHLDCTHWKIPPWEKGLRKRLAWALYMQDKWGALVHGRPSHIDTANWIVQPLSPNDFPEDDYDDGDVEEKQESEQGRTLFVQMVYLTQILAEILDTFYTLRAMQTVTNAGPQGTSFVLSLAKPIQLKLKDWYGALPTSIRMDSSFQTVSSTSTRLTSIGSLHLAYFATEITLHRRIIRSLAADSQAIDAYVQHICRSAAKARLISAMDFVNRLTPLHLQAFWFFASKTSFALIGTFGSLLWATSPGREEADWYRRRLGEYRWTLSVSSKPGGSAKLTEFAMGMLDISTGLLKQLPEKPELSRNSSAVDMDLVGARRQILASCSSSKQPHAGVAARGGRIKGGHSGAASSHLPPALSCVASRLTPVPRYRPQPPGRHETSPTRPARTRDLGCRGRQRVHSAARGTRYWTACAVTWPGV